MNSEDIDPKNQISAPVPIRGSQGNGVRNTQSSGETPHPQIHAFDRSSINDGFGSLTPNTSRRVANRRPSYNSIEVSRESHYNLDYPEDPKEVSRLQLDPKSRFYARNRPRTLNLHQMLPYETELPKDQAKFLSHIVSHLYIAIKTLDIQGSLSVTARDLAALKNVSGLSDLDIALETNLFEMNTEGDHLADDDANTYFSVDEYADSESEADDDEAEDVGDIEKDRNESVSQHKKSPKSAAVVGVRIWTNELLVWLKMKYEMPITLRIALAKVYYAICLCRGQYINLKIYVKAFELLTKDVQLLKQNGLVLEWKDLLNELKNHFSSIDCSIDNFEKKDNKQLLRLAERGSNFFDSEALPIIYESLGQHISISNPSLVLCSMSLLPFAYSGQGIESIYDIRHYISSFFYLWEKFHKSHELDSHLTSRTGTLAMSALAEINENGYKNIPVENEDIRNTFGAYGIYTESQIEMLLNNLLNNLGISQEKFGSNNSNFFHGYSSTLVFSIKGSNALDDNGILDKIRTLLNAIESYVHPTNSGNWTKSISKLVYSLVYQFQKRFNQEHNKYGVLGDLPDELKLNPQVVNRFVEILLPIVRTGLQSKKPAAVDNYLSALSTLAYLNSELVLETVLLDLYESLEGVISTHRVSVALRALDELARYFASTKIYRVHLTRLLSLAIPGIDSNDLEKTLLTLNLFQTVANFVPFHDLTNGDGVTNLAIDLTQNHIDFLQRKIYSSFYQGQLDDDFMSDNFEVSEDLEIEALKSSTAAFPVLLKTLVQKIFTLLENIPDPSKSGGMEKTIADSLPSYLYIIFESLSDDIFKQVRNTIFDFVFNNTIHTVADIVAEVCGGLIKRDPTAFPKYSEILISRIKEEIEENGSGSSRTGIDIVPRDRALFWYLIVLNECIGNASANVVDVADDLNQLVYYLMEHVKGPTVFASSYIVNQILQSITKIKIRELRLVSPTYAAKNGITEQCWGGFQFDERRFSEENLTFDWYLPTDKEVKLAVDFFTDLTSKVLGNISSLMQSHIQNEKKDASSSIELTDDLKNNFLYLSYALSGVSFLFDPSFEEDIPKLNQHQNETIQQRLLLLKQIRSVKDETSRGADESRIENLQENLQRIVDDMSNDDLIQYNDEDEASEPASPDLKDSSVRASPGIEGVPVSQMNPGITFRERKLYTSRYYFGDDMEKRRSSDLYIKLHRFRYSIGRSLHLICKFLTAHFHDNTKLLKHFLYVVNMWISDVGRERLLDQSHAKVDYTFINNTQSINRVRKPFTRIAIGSRLEAYHSLRVALHATSRTQTDLDKLLLEDLVKMAVSTYSAVAKPAQASLIDAMKRLNGSYNVIIRSSLKYLSKALDEKNNKKIESGLGMFNLRRIKSKIQNDYFNLQKFVSLLHRCLLVDGLEVNELAQKLFKGVYTNITPPSSVCLINFEYIDSIRPPDAYIDLEINAVKQAKEKKRSLYLEKLRKLENCVVLNESSSNYWKLSSLNLSLLIDLQLDLEIPTNDEIFRLLAKQASSDHPIISRLALKGITKIMNKLYVRQLMSYDLKNLFDLEYINPDVKVIKTNDPDSSDSYYLKWRKEMEHSEKHDFYIDNKANTGWLFWGEEMKVVTNEPRYELKLDEIDLEAVKSFGNCITKQWFYNIVKLWVTDNEANSAYQATDVYFTSTIVLLISNGVVDEMSFNDLLAVVEEIYEKDDKSVHIVVCEILAGILISSKFLTADLIEKRDVFITRFLKTILENDLSPDTSNIWTVFSWWVPAHIDSRRFPEITDLLIKFKLDKQSDFAFRDSMRLSYIRSFVAAITWKFTDPEEVLGMCLDNVNHHYQAVREQIGSLLSMLTFVYYPDSAKDFKTFTQLCNSPQGVSPAADKIKEIVPVVFERIEAWRLEVVDKTPQEILKSDYIYASMTVLTWLKQALCTSISAMYQDFVVSHAVPFLIKLINMKEVCQLGNINPIGALKLMSQLPFNDKNLANVVLMLGNLYHKEKLNVVQSIVVGEFTETFYFKNLLKLKRNQRAVIINLTNELLFHKQVSVRESAASTLAGLIHISPPNEIEGLIHKFTENYKHQLDQIRKKYRKGGFRNIPAEHIVILHGATLGLGSLIHAFSFLSPPPKWVPELLTILANKSSGIPGLVGKTAKESLGKFKKTRQDTWHVDSKVFNETQMQDLEGVLMKSYFI
ncbi:hypothetical protein CANTEDRAFT_126233 [Yamadazyma tenuis ATCC 10573]|uniref:ARM repeat-containing protein n=1 Tax=Candida tenuis (strain ATCC 10573 / BCRC 21748 / CBS 615 / JCM 9827 / NBRC 10315 / NRRL Y-1498 / VKM Y-70) TaxID=590646 RepID=G3B8E6_CANTC|nr:uncharacterized protein CANTEDRAFT_126233 [Yamadazyma tenuis ATCC 10573]EGV62380.1 hypothetical protein CANTEDRAFT_126233 [Yamadazyma tenuis ATCC 10573]